MKEEVKHEDLLAYLAGELSDGRLREQIARESEIEGSYVHRWMEEMGRRARDPFGLVDWRRLASVEEGQEHVRPEVGVSQADAVKGRRSNRYAAIMALVACVLVIAGIFWPIQQSAVEIKDGNLAVVTVDASGRVTGLEDYPVDSRDAVESLVTRQRFTKSAALEEVEAAFPILKSEAPATTVLIEPVGTMVQSARPMFSWKGLEGGVKSYRVVIYDAGSKEVTASGSILKTEWAPPQDLERGNAYSWKVFAIGTETDWVAPKPGERKAVFGVMSKDREEILRRRLVEAKDSHLLQFLAYTDVGLLQEAEGELEALSVENPRSEIVRRLREGFRDFRK